MRALAILSLLLAILLAPGSRSAAQPAASPRAAEVRAEVRSILASREFATRESKKSWVEQIGDVLLRPLKRFAAWLKRKLPSFDVPTASGPLGEVLTAVAYGLLFGGAVYLLARMIAAMAAGGMLRGRSERRRPLVTSAAIGEPDPAAEPDAWIEQARKFAAQGELRAAYRAAFTAILVRLDRIGAIRYERQRTNGEYLRALRAKPSLVQTLRPVVRDFDARWYGPLPVTERDYRRLLDTYERLASEPAA